ncbi:hypothetical protein IGI39_003704 [Enterococcus sp. AZ135]|uniref:hypothetical protein n=1 Tax=unclassified Enterococcus TaxID=2608891 RepID=UPI003F20ED41
MREIVLVGGSILVVLLLFSLVNHFSKRVESDPLEHDLIVSIKMDPAPDIIQHIKIKKLAAWEIYGEGVFRGKSQLTKEEMKQLLINELCLPEETVIVVEAREKPAK